METINTNAQNLENNVKEILSSFGYDLTSEHLKDTPKRYIKALKEFHSQDNFNFSTFNSEITDIVTVSEIRFYSLCEHHLFPFFGYASISYIPNGKIVGISKLPRIVNKFSRKLQNQERLTNEIISFLEENLNPNGIAVGLTARHLCMEMRGVKSNSLTKTIALRGYFSSDENIKNIFLSIFNSIKL